MRNGDAEEVGLELEARKRIYRYIRENPGAHLREIKRALSLPMGALEHHLRYMESREILVAKKERYYKRYYPLRMSSKDKVILAGLRQKRPRAIVLYLVLNPESKHKEMMSHFDLGASTLSFYLKDLLEKGILTRIKKGRESLYSVADAESVVRVIITYKPSFLDKLVDRFLEIWFERHRTHSGPGPDMRPDLPEDTTFELLDDE